MALRRGDPARLLAAVNAQRAALGRSAWSGPVTAQTLGAGSVHDVLAAIDAGLAPEPGARRAVEVRIPPFAAIQCLAGPRHTRGTPPNVVETDALTWILLATGRLGWT